MPEAMTDERASVEKALAELRQWQVLTGTGDLDFDHFAELRRKVRARFKIPWTSITPPMELLLYSIVAVQQPRYIVAIGIFCGNTLIWNIGPAYNPRASYRAESVVGVEIDEQSADLARTNIASLNLAKPPQILTADGHKVLEEIRHPIDYLYLDANGPLPEGGPTPNASISRCWNGPTTKSQKVGWLSPTTRYQNGSKKMPAVIWSLFGIRLTSGRAYLWLLIRKA